jgi:predicted transcriptional regulator
MTPRKELHKLIDALPDEQIGGLRQFIQDLQPEDENLDAQTLAAIREGLEDIEHGRVMDVEEYRRTRGL